MSIIYSCIARGTTILCSHGIQTGKSNYEEAVTAILPQIPTRNDGKTTVNASNTKFHCIVENGIIFLCAAKPGFETRPCFAFLTEMKDKFHSEHFADQAVTARSHEFDADFNAVLAKQMSKYSKPGTTDNITVLQGQVKEVQGVMSQNIEAVIQRGERLDDLMDKTDELEAASATFQRTASKIKKKYFWRNMKMKIIIGCVVFAIIVGITLAIMGGLGVFSSSSTSSATTPMPPPAKTTIRLPPPTTTTPLPSPATTTPLPSPTTTIPLPATTTTPLPATTTTPLPSPTTTIPLPATTTTPLAPPATTNT